MKKILVFTGLIVLGFATITCQRGPLARAPEPTATLAAPTTAPRVDATAPASTPVASATQTAPTASSKSSSEWITAPVLAPRLQFRTFASAAITSDVSYHIYTPEAYDTETQRRFPTLYWLHGSGGGLAGLPTLVSLFDWAIRAGKLPPILVVFPNGHTDSMWCDSKDGSVPMETVVVKELLPHIDATFRTVATRDARLIEGFSMGGYGAGRLGLKYPEQFGAISMLGAGPLQPEFTAEIGPAFNAQARIRIMGIVYGNDQNYFRAASPWVLAEQNRANAIGTRIRLAVGDRDAMLAYNREFDARLTALNIPHQFIIVPGIDHTPGKLLNALGFDFYREAFGR
ncbi:MAG: esterase family protein [Chloroflexi bacterium]|nr:esterase family protein [Chloroflexota bacterium]